MSEISIEVRGLEETARRMEQAVTDLQGTPIVGAMRESTLLVERYAKIGAPVDTGRLRASITPVVVSMAGEVKGIVGSNVAYACIYDAHTRITTINGSKTIGQVEVGDYVLTQSGEYRRVVAKTMFPVTEKPDLVEIEVPWRSGKTHKVTVTVDHKVLAYRNGRNKWILAGDLVATDMLYSRRKLVHNRGTAAVHTCLNCGIQYTYDKVLHQGKKFCSLACKHEYWHDKGHNPHIGMVRSKESRENMSAAAILKLAEHPELHPSRIVARHGHVTNHEKEIRDWLTGIGQQFGFQHPVGTHVVDFYIPDTQTIIEADGAFWHQDQAVDIERDRTIIESMPDAKIIHVHFTEQRFTPNLDHNPLPNVYYVAVNPGMHSYTDPTQFEARPIISLRKWRYERPIGRAGACVPMLYDLAVDGVHSFFANGILVSNSYQELGTVKMKAHPYLRPAFERARQQIIGFFESAIAAITRRANG